MCFGYKGVRDYGIVIELLRGNIVEPVTPPTQHVSPQNVLSSSAVIHTAIFLTVLYSTRVVASFWLCIQGLFCLGVLCWRYYCCYLRKEEVSTY